MAAPSGQFNRASPEIEDRLQFGAFFSASQAKHFFLLRHLTYISLPCITRLMKLEKDLVAASSVPLVLSILTEGESYGYAIIQRVKELSGGDIEWTDGMLYPVLHWLEDQDLVRSRWMEAETGRKRKYYSLKSEGRKALRKHKEQWTLVNSVLNQLWKPQHV